MNEKRLTNRELGEFRKQLSRFHAKSIRCGLTDNETAQRKEIEHRVLSEEAQRDRERMQRQMAKRAGR